MRKVFPEIFVWIGSQGPQVDLGGQRSIFVVVENHEKNILGIGSL